MVTAQFRRLASHVSFARLTCVFCDQRRILSIYTTGPSWLIMALEDNTRQSSLLDSDQPSSIGPQGDHLNQLPFKQIFLGVNLDGVHTDIVIGDYRDRVLIVITQCAKIAAFVSAQREVAQEDCGALQEVFKTKTLFGVQKQEDDELSARFLTEQTKLHKTAVFALGLRDQSPRTLRALARVINDNKWW